MMSPSNTRRRMKFPLFFLIGAVIIIAAYILGGASLAITHGWRFLLGIIAGIATLLIIGVAKRGRAKRK